jgi:hypothetical protein
MAQSVEHVLGKDGVGGSNPPSSSKKRLFSLENGRFYCSFFSYSQDFFENIRTYLYFTLFAPSKIYEYKK